MQPIRSSCIWHARAACAALLLLANPAAAREPLPAAPAYPEHQDLGYYLTPQGERRTIVNPAQWQQRRAHILAHVQSVTGPLPQPACRVPLDVRVLHETAAAGWVLRKITFRSEARGGVPAWLFLPAAPCGSRPAVLCLHQTTKIGKDEPAGLGGNPNMHYARELAERGFVTLAPDYPSLGEHAWELNETSGYASGTMKAVWDNMRAVDLLCTLPQVDPRRIGCLGHSLGGHNALFTALFEPRIAAVVCSCGFSRFHKDDLPSWTGPRYMPRIASRFGNDPNRVPFDFTEIVAALAPRPFLACAAEGDDDFDVTGVRDVMASADAIYALYGARGHLRAHYSPGKHDFSPAARDVAYQFLEHHLKQDPARPVRPGAISR